MAPEHHGPRVAVIDARCPDVEHEAILAFTRQVLAGDGQFAGRRSRWIALWSALTIFERIADAGPFFRIGWRHEAIGTRRACAIRNSLKDLDAVIVDSADFAEGCFGGDKLGILSPYALGK